MRPGNPSITRRLILTLTAGTAIFWCIAALGSTYVFNEELNETFDLALQETAQRLLPLAIDDVASHGDHEPRALMHSLGGHVEYLNYQIDDAAGHILLRTPDTGDAPADLYDGAPASGFRSVGDYRTYSETDPHTGIRLIVAETTSHRQEAIADSTRTLFWPLLALIPLSVLGIWLAVNGTLRPVKRLGAEIAARDSSNLAPLDATGQPAELKPMVEAIGRLMGRLKLALDAERAFAANSAHELRTPIAGALAQTQMLIAELGEGAAAHRAGEIEAALRRLSNLSEKLLQISRVDAGLGAPSAPVDLRPVLDLVIRDCRLELNRPERLTLAVAPGAALVAPMDLDAFAIAVRNLIDNAVKHGRPGGAIRVCVGADRTLAVISEGDVVPPASLAQLTGRFARGPTGASGSGLGLAIVQAIMQQSGGSLELRSPATGSEEGFEAVLRLPG